jgi:pheromone shutdown protein TraB
MSKISGWIIPALIVGLIGYTLMQSTQMGLQQIKSWFLWNGLLSAFGTLLCASHPLTVLTALVAAPFTSLNPLLAAGWFAGLTEAVLRKPKVSDFSNLSEDVATFKGFYKNRVTHILMVVIMANVFSSLATIISGLDIVKTFFSAL